MNFNPKNVFSIYERELKRYSKWLHERRVLYEDKAPDNWGCDPLDNGVKDSEKFNMFNDYLDGMELILEALGLKKRMRAIISKYNLSITPNSFPQKLKETAVKRLRRRYARALKKSRLLKRRGRKKRKKA
ncbi:MAG: hypothetical protein AAB432_00870 [Patescibacteria group bacterium]